MNQKDYKKIAEIIKKQLDILPLSQSSHYLEKVAEELADYFEKEIKERNELISLPNTEIKPFNKAQFLKDCGVKPA